MSALHAHFLLRNQQAFQRALEGHHDRGQSTSGAAAALSNSGKKSWSRPSTLTAAMSSDVNTRDWLGRTVLHLACASTDAASLEYVRLLLNQPSINVNILDAESHWTPLHRALYHGNLPAALLLLERPDIDPSLKDLEGYTAFDLYNSTLEGTKPLAHHGARSELYTWGTNRNAALGFDDSGDRLHPDQVVIQPKGDLIEQEGKTLSARFSPINVRQVAMSGLHSAVVTSESQGNLRICGFGSGGRLGPGQYTQYKLKPLNQFTHTIVAVALGQDHTLALTKAGEILSWGLNRFSQLGYVVESNTLANLGKIDEPIQAIPRKIQGPLKKEIVKGVAASKFASACWTSTEVFTWGTNNGQLGYDKNAQPVQILPRKVTKVTQPVIAIAMTDFALACLLNTNDIVCIWNDRSLKINFPTQAFPSEIQVYRPPQAIKDANIAKITSSHDMFAALSSNGEVFTFCTPDPSDFEARERAAIKPQRVWALRKQFSAVKDVALGSDGSIIICTESGHVFVRSRNAKSGQASSAKAFKFQRVAFIQRIVEVCANTTGAFGALRIDFQPKAIDVTGNVFNQDLAGVQPYTRFLDLSQTSPRPLQPKHVIKPIYVSSAADGDDEDSDVTVQKDIRELARLCEFLMADRELRRNSSEHGLFKLDHLPHGADMIIQLESGTVIPVHRVILAARCSALLHIFSGAGNLHDAESNLSVKLQSAECPTAHPAVVLRLCFSGCQPISVLILLAYLYSDELLAIWDRRVGGAIDQYLISLKIKPADVRLDLRRMGRLLDIPLMVQALESHAKREPLPSMVTDMTRLFHSVQTTIPYGSPLKPDVILRLADKDVFCHSAVLRARSVFFADFFDDPDWTLNRRDSEGVVTVQFKHLEWRAMEFVLEYLCCGSDIEMFNTLDFVNTLDEVLEFMFEVMAAANELFLDRLVLLCSSIVLKYASINNACNILATASHLHARQLVESLRGYFAANMELFLETRMLIDLPPDVVADLAVFVRRKQAEKSTVSRSGMLVNAALRNQADWLALQDIPTPIVRADRQVSRKTSAQLSPSTPRRLPRPSLGASPTTSPSIRPQSSRPVHATDDVFVMDEGDVLPPLSLDLTQVQAVSPVSGTPKPVAGWRAASSVPRVDMKTIMAETASSFETRSSPGRRTGGLHVASDSQQAKPDQRAVQRERYPPTLSGVSVKGHSASLTDTSRSPGSPWRTLSSTTPPGPQSIIFPSAGPIPSGSSHIGIPPARDATALPPKPRSSSNGNTASKAPATTHTGPQSTLGPIFTPSRRPVTKPDIISPRRVSSGGKAWTLPPVQPAVAPSPPTSGMSFVAIQQLQLEQAAPVVDKRSLRDIQEEERARQVEDDFMKWWAAEEERLRLEAEAPPPPPAPRKSPKKHQNSRGKGKSQSVRAVPALQQGPPVTKSDRNTSRANATS